MIRLLFAASLISLSAGCADQRQPTLAHQDCSDVQAYSGAPLRAPIDATTLRITSHSASGLNSGEIDALKAAFLHASEATGAPSLTAAVWQAGGAPWAQSSGTPAGHVHYWASVGKIITSAAVLKLYEDGRLSLDQPISSFIDGVPNGEIITIRMLLDHTSGLFSANEDTQIRANGIVLDLESVLEVINRRAPYACPGSAWRYSNSGYILLSAVIEEVTSQPYHVAAYDLVLAQNAGRDVRLLGPNSSLEGVVLPVSSSSAPAEDIRQPRGAGAAVATAESMSLFLRDLLSGQVLDDQTTALMFEELYPMFEDGLSYGLGVMAFDVPGDTGPQLWVGHSGGAPGARAILVFSPEIQSIAAVALTGDGSVEATANLFFSVLANE